MPKKQVVTQPNQEPQYDPQTIAFIKSAKASLGKNHGILIDRDPAEVMRENNQALRDAAKKLSAQKGMVKQKLQHGLPKATRPVAQPSPIAENTIAPVDVPMELTDVAMRAQGYDTLMESMMDAPNDGELADMEIQPTYTPNFRQPPQTANFSGDDMHEAALVEPIRNEAAIPQSPVRKPVQPPRQQVRLAEAYPQSDVTNFSDVRGLPSEGLLYDQPIMGQSLTFMDILMMNHMDNGNVVSTVNTLFTRRLRGGWAEGLVATDLLQCDDAYLLHWLRASTIDEPLPYVPPGEKWEPYKCPECKHVATTPEDYKNLVITFNNLNFKIKGNVRDIVAKHQSGCYTFTMPDQRQCDVYLRRRYHDQIINDTLAQYKSDMGTEMPLEMQIILHTAVVVEFEGLTNIVEKINYIGNLGYRDAKYFYDQLEGASLITDITAKVICPFCKKEVVIPYPFRLEYYISSL